MGSPVDEAKLEKRRAVEELLESRMKNLASSAWDRFGTRHMIAWITAVACMTGLIRLIKAIEYSYTLSVPSLLESWQRVPMQASDIEISIAYGTFLGLGIPAVFARTRDGGIWENPARVVFGLMIGLSLLDLFTMAMVAGIFGNQFHPTPELASLGEEATALVWIFYVLFRSRIGWHWKFFLLLLSLSVLAEFIYGSWSMLLNFRRGTVISNATLFVHEISVSVGSLALCLMVCLASVYEYWKGKYRDWRIMVLAIACPIGTIAIGWRLVFEIVRAIQLENWG